MMRGLLPTFKVALFAAFVTQLVSAQDSESHTTECTSREQLKPARTASPNYTEEALRKDVEGTVVLCLTIGERGRVTDVKPMSGPSELLQPSIDAAKQWEFAPPQRAPAHLVLEDIYHLPPKPPVAGRVMLSMMPYSENKSAEKLKIVGKVHQPLPMYPDALKAERVRGQLYVSMVVNADGNVSDVGIVKSLDDRLDALTVETVRGWKFKVTSDGKPASFFLTFSFF